MIVVASIAAVYVVVTTVVLAACRGAHLADELERASLTRVSEHPSAADDDRIGCDARTRRATYLGIGEQPRHRERRAVGSPSP